MPINLSVNPSRTRASVVFAHRPGNLLTADIVGQLHAALEDLAELPHLRLVTIEGAGADFSFGASIPEHAPGEIERVLPAIDRVAASVGPPTEFEALTAAAIGELARRDVDLAIVEVGINDAPKADEIIYILAMGTGPRVHDRAGGLKASEIKGEDGQR